MRIEKKYKLEKAVSKDRPSLSIIKRIGDRLVATNGHALASVPIEVEETDTADGVSPEALIAARKATRTFDVPLGLGETQAIPGGQTFPKVDASSFPDVERVSKAARESYKIIRVGINAKSLHALAEALGDDVVELEISSPFEPIFVRPIGDAFGVLMPCVIDRKKAPEIAIPDDPYGTETKRTEAA